MKRTIGKKTQFISLIPVLVHSVHSMNAILNFATFIPRIMVHRSYRKTVRFAESCHPDPCSNPFDDDSGAEKFCDNPVVCFSYSEADRMV